MGYVLLHVGYSNRSMKIKVILFILILFINLFPFYGVFADLVYITNSRSNNISVIDTKTNRVTTSIEVGNAPRGVALTSNGRTIYAVNSGSNTVSVISAISKMAVATINAMGNGTIKCAQMVMDWNCDFHNRDCFWHHVQTRRRANIMFLIFLFSTLRLRKISKHLFAKKLKGLTIEKFHDFKGE